jgi:hypothetical protein
MDTSVARQQSTDDAPLRAPAATRISRPPLHEPTAAPPKNKARLWFKRAVWLGIFSDWLIALPLMLFPEWTLTTLHLRVTEDPIWTAFGAMLLLLVTFFYIPGANEPDRFRLSAALAPISRASFVLFFFLLYPEHYALLGARDAVMLLLQLPLFIAVLRSTPRPTPEPVQAAQAPVTDRSTHWLCWTLWLGIIADSGLGLPSVFKPQAVLALAGVRASLDPFWTAFAGLNLFLLGIFYIPGALRPYQNRFTAIGAVMARPPGIIFFLLVWRGVYPIFGLLDSTLLLLQLPFLIKVMQLIPVRRFWDVDPFEYRGSTFHEVKQAAFAGPYAELPKHKGVGPGTFLQLCADAARNMYDRRDIRPRYDKLIHSHGVCYSGLWEIDQNSPYTGYFKRGSRGLLIARTSVAAMFTTQGHRRALGIGGKIFPTLDPHEKVWPGNFVTVSTLSGSRARHVLDIDVSNFAFVGADPGANLINRVIFRLVDTRPGYRQLYPVASLGLKPGDPVVTPDLLLLKPKSGTPRVDAKDFRDEIRLKNYPEGRLVYDILVKNFDESQWQRIGSITLTEDTISEGSDKRLHFWIPRDLPNLPKPKRSDAP